ncbi:efflux RND transporter periplasmic adaptor subunit [Horticoccus sp. 23ND18S-11]|uniref:efflux RND transporter periplasmic adaptor subunit n=1 Tax=Horticoccus sp. 23ND18S-11 TaxID=3391832 RepID=UPI0039C8E9B7
MSSHALFPNSFRSTAAVLTSLAFTMLAACNRTPPPAAAPAAGVPAATKSAPPAAPGTSPATAAVPPAPGARRAAEAEKEKARQSAAEMVPVETALVSRGPISAFLAFNSTLETEAMVDIYPQTTGQVETLLVEEGRIVNEGDPLLKIEDRELRVDADESTANYDQLKKNFARSEDLYSRKLINKQDFETQAYQLEQARLRLERARIRLAYATVRAPFSGIISSRETQVGARVTSGSKLFSMVKLDEIVARVFVPGRYLPIVAEKQPAVVTSEFLPNRIFKGWVKRISPVIDPKSGTFKVTVGVTGEKPTDLPPGLFVNVRVITDTRSDAVLIPKRAVVYEGGERYVFTIVNDRAVKRKLPAGYEDPQNIEALSGFEVGTPVVVLGQSGLKDGSLVRSVNAPAIVPAAEAAVAPVPTPAGEAKPPVKS